MAENLNACPEVARAPQIATDVCAKLGHKLSTYQNGSRMTANGPEMSVINFCSACGLSLAEVRGEIDKRINEAVQIGVQQHISQLNAALKNPPGVGAGPFAVPLRNTREDVEDQPQAQPVVVESSST